MKKEIRPSRRVEDIKEYYFSRKLKEIAKLNAEGADIISLAIGGPDLPPPADAVEAAVDALRREDTHGYQMTVGLPELRRAFADWYARYYHVEGIDPDRELLPLIGSKEGCVAVSLAFLNPGDKVLVPNPGYPTYTSAARIAQADIIYYNLDPGRGWQPDFKALEDMDLSDVRMMWVNYPNMPTGAPASLELYRKFVEFGRRNGILIVNDNPYSFIRNEEPLSIMQIPGAKEVCIEMNSLSKCMNMAGWRVGMLTSNPTFVEWVLKIKSNTDSGQPKAVMLGAIEALRQPKEWYDALNDVYYRRERTGRLIMDALGCECADGQQGLFLWGRVPESEESGEALADRVLREARVFITPGFIFGSAGDRYVRLSLCAKEEKLTEALGRIRAMKS